MNLTKQATSESEALSNKPKMAPDWNAPVLDAKIRMRHLPHIEVAGSYYFTTTCTYGSRFLDESERTKVLNAILFLDGKKYDLYAAVVMSNHFHLLFKPLDAEGGGSISLSSIFHSIKSFTSKQIGRKVWQADNHDHVIRNDNDYHEKLNYIRNNPVEASIVSLPEDYSWLWIRSIPA